MWDSKKESFTAYLVTLLVFSKAGIEVRAKCQYLHRFNIFRAIFLEKSFNYQPSMPVINKIDCKREESTRFFPFAPSIFNESSISNNLAFFEDLNVLQMGLVKTDAQWLDCFTLWWDNLKTTNHMLGMQSQKVRMNRPYNRYKYLFSGFVLWNLQFNYLKMIWELFYLSGSSTEHSTLQ